MRLEDELKAYARAIGIHSLGIGSAAPFPEEAALLESMREEGTYPAFTERDPALRTRPGRWLKNAASVIAIAVSYHSQEHHHPPARAASSGAWSPATPGGRDYHPILKEKLDAVVSFLSQRVDRPVDFAPFVDTGPPVDRAVAVRAGIGWFGKNACIYVPAPGSWVFLAEIVTDVELEPDPPVIQVVRPVRPLHPGLSHRRHRTALLGEPV